MGEEAGKEDGGTRRRRRHLYKEIEEAYMHADGILIPLVINGGGR
jgi:hypothetical protein